MVCILFAFGCSCECGLEKGAICNGGLCERGDCVCPPYLIGPNCKYRCPGPESSPCNDRGAEDARMTRATRHTSLCMLTSSTGKCLLPSDATVQNAVCFCVEQFRGVACTIPCPVFSGSVCSGRGLCNGNGTCDCIAGFVGSDCSKECAGGSMMPCSGWGTCLSNGSCACDAGRYGEHCQARCASNKGTICSGRGILCYVLQSCEGHAFSLRRVL
jgi:hypothetical protein